MILVTGGCGFIGSAFLLQWLTEVDEPVVNLDLLTYAGHPGNLAGIQNDPRYHFVHGDIGDSALVAGLLARAPAARGGPFRRREPCRPLDLRARWHSRRPT